MATNDPGESSFADAHQEILSRLSVQVKEASLPTPCPVQGAFQRDQVKFFTELMGELDLKDDLSPGEVLRRGLSALNRIETRAFVVHNILESVKQGKSLTQTLEAYRVNGLVEVNVSPVKAQPVGPGVKPPNGKLLLKAMSSLKRIATTMIEVILNAIREIPDLVGIKPSVGIAGMFPTISFEIEPQTKSARELWDALTASFN